MQDKIGLWALKYEKRTNSLSDAHDIAAPSYKPVVLLFSARVYWSYISRISASSELDNAVYEFRARITNPNAKRVCGSIASTAVLNCSYPSFAVNNCRNPYLVRFGQPKYANIIFGGRGPAMSPPMLIVLGAKRAVEFSKKMASTHRASASRESVVRSPRKGRTFLRASFAEALATLKFISLSNKLFYKHWDNGSLANNAFLHVGSVAQ